MPAPRDRVFRTFADAGGDPWDYGGPLTNDVAEVLPPSAAGNRIKYDSTLKGFGLRVTSGGGKAFVLNYRANRRERRITIGSFPDWSAAQARAQAAALRRQVDVGDDPMAERHAMRAAPLVSDLIDRFDAEHIARRRPGTQAEYRRPLRTYIRPMLGRILVTEVTHSDVERVHRHITQSAPFAANRAVAVVSKMFSMAVKWDMRPDNPARGIERTPEQPRERYLTADEIARLAAVLDAHPERNSANAVMLLMLTGARRNEVLFATWNQFDLDAGTWTKPHTLTKQGRAHRVPLSPQALALLTTMRRSTSELFLFPGQKPGRSLTEVKRFWASVCRQAGIEGARLHDLRHTYASVLASSGLSLPIIGALLGHSQPSTTQRYAHLLDDPLREATTIAGRVLTGRG